MKELDLLLTRWLDREFEHASPGQRALFERLLALPDPQLASYLVAGDKPAAGDAADAAADAAELAALIHSIRNGSGIMSSPVTTGREP
jgi:succinate dehydrogenase flavin-adding protein (antitoxin of CptAB toxin-antitoxin module)